MPLSRKNWDAKIKGLGCSPREFVTQNAAGHSDLEIAKRLTSFGFPTTNVSVAKARTQLGIAKESRGGGKGGVVKYHVSESPYQRYDKPIEIETDKIAVWGDPEFPFQEHEFMNRVLDLCDCWGVRKVAVAGDMLHHAALSSWGAEWTDDPEKPEDEDYKPEMASELAAEIAGLPKNVSKARLQKIIEQHMADAKQEKKEEAGEGISHEWKHSRKALASIRQVFTDELILAIGNHEARLLNALQSPIFPSDLKRLLVDGDDKWFKVGPYYYGIIKSGGQVWRFTHPKNTSVIPAIVAAQLADKYGQNVIMGHNHLWGQVQSVSGKYMGVEIGCMVDGARLEYYAQRDTTRPVWTHGAAIIRDGHCYLLHESRTDWKAMRKLA